MNIQASEQWARRRPIAAGLLVMLAGPLLGLCPILAWFALGLGEFSLGYLTVRSVIFGAYCLGGIQSAIAGLLVAAAIYRHDWISIRHWAAITAILALPPILLLVMNDRNVSGRPGLIYISDLNIILYLIVAALFASVVLRLLIIRLGWMRRP